MGISGRVLDLGDSNIADLTIGSVFDLLFYVSPDFTEIYPMLFNSYLLLLKRGLSNSDLLLIRLSSYYYDSIFRLILKFYSLEFFYKSVLY